jgi:DNA/RNA-binding domain of Phe-tRNA-synthetase-like protein
LLAAYAAAPLRPDEALRTAVRGMLRQRGYRPTGRGKPSSEYLAGAAREGRLAPINAIVDAGNAVSLHSGLPISVVDLDRARAPLRIAVAAAGATYVFNKSGQAIDVGGLPCLFDAEGPCANAVKDAQRTKTDAATARVLAIVWGLAGPEAARTEATLAWLGEVFTRLGARVHDAPTG